LIFLALAPLFKTTSGKIKEKKDILWTVYLTLASLMISVMAILVWPLLPGMKYNEYLYVIARIAFVLGLFGVGATIYVVWRRIPEPESAANGHGN
jgi:hypothetical protein